MQIDIAGFSAQTPEKLGWNPRGPGLLVDLENMTYAQR
jgi:hypothetical protein